VDRITRREIVGIAWMCLAMGLGLVMETLPRSMSRAYSPFEIVWIRYGAHLLLMIVLWGPTAPGRLVRTARPGLHAIRALTMLGMPAAFVLAIMHAPRDRVLSLVTVEPLLAMVLAAVWLGERVRARQWAAGAVACAGALMLFPPSGIPRGSWVIPALSVAACFALYQALTRFMREETGAARLFYTALGVWLPLSLGLPWFWRTPTLHDLVLMSAVGVLGFLSLLGIDRALDAAPVSRVAPFALAQPVAGVVVEVVLLAQAPSPAQLGGILVVLVGWAASVWPARHTPGLGPVVR
jgi:drug/metabolite transporter (DMT)-like permease